VKHLFLTKPNFEKYTEADEIYKRMLKMRFPEVEWWEKMIDYYEKFLHQKVTTLNLKVAR